LYSAVNTFHLGYKNNQFMLYKNNQFMLCQAEVAAYSEINTKTHKYGAGRM
jgi:hypothetical protein